VSGRPPRPPVLGAVEGANVFSNRRERTYQILTRRPGVIEAGCSPNRVALRRPQTSST
jgi:hypothetical protein